ncbi:amidohydrolase family protein [Panacibacter ginsenosidivorans]|uniref:Amidohydrolase family protein n=1 Tax=Panacibacter ginsenosidivorans TaxID=1813871 RepID=A0A5B8V4M6_9BACT|nr:amidohydrolase family protein [Panacibacter ginsenosidivorans]QEC66128.1 amidohydrolase family protein [Panacibacter ginsenosidivorans]
MRKKSLYLIICSITALLVTIHIYAQDSAKRRHLPIIDVHVHAMKMNPAFAADMCPWFLSDMPGGDPNQPPPAFINTDCAMPLKAAKSDKEFQDSLMATMKRLNMTIIASGDASILHNWQQAAEPGRVIPSIGISSSKDMTVVAFTDSLSSGFYKVMGETAPQYQGMSPSDTSLDAYFAAAEKLNIPVGIHMGTGGNGTINITNPKYRASMGNPLLLEDLLARHPKLKVWVMHAGYPMADEMIALMGANAYVYVDVAGMIWSYPLAEVNDYIKRLVQAGFEKRIMYGTDLMIWPKLLETSIGVIENANYLSFDQKRDILFNNAVRFFRLDASKYQ